MSLNLHEIVIDPAIQPRVQLDQDAIERYAEAMAKGDEFPPIVVYFDGTSNWLSQGFHRAAAAVRAGLTHLPIDVRKGTRDDAIWDAVGSNLEHKKAGKALTKADTRRAVEMALKVRPNAPSREIARQCHVDDKTVARIRSSAEFRNTGSIRIGKNGKTYGLGVNSHNPDGPLPGQTSFLESVEPETALFAAVRVLADEARADSGGPFVLDGETQPKKSRPTFNQTNEKIDWARWSWNPVTGCEHNCFYCYARDLANDLYAEKFTPTYRPERLEAPRNTKLPGDALQESDPVQRTAWKNVFVCSMADLFGRWVPDDWIESVFDSCRKSPEWNYLFLTKFPQRYADLDFPETAWVGTTVDEQKRVANAEKAFSKITAPIKWLSCEPMLEPLQFENLSVFDWIVIGGCAKSSGGPQRFPEAKWVFKLTSQAIDAGCKIYFKENISKSSGFARELKEYPDVYFQS